MRILLALSVAIVALQVSGCSRPATAESRSAERPGWLTDYAQAQAEAKTQQKLLLLDFTGSDWCGWCMRLQREVFETPDFQEYAQKNLILLELDFPRGKALPPAQAAQNQKLAQQLGIDGFPTIVIMNGEGRILGTLGYTPGGPSAFISELKKLHES
ncbi:MAG: thioredoxin family protein [Chthoniobacterales bacterium]